MKVESSHIELLVQAVGRARVVVGGAGRLQRVLRVVVWTDLRVAVGRLARTAPQTDPSTRLRIFMGRSSWWLGRHRESFSRGDGRRRGCEVLDARWFASCDFGEAAGRIGGGAVDGKCVPAASAPSPLAARLSRVTRWHSHPASCNLRDHYYTVQLDSN